MSHVSQVSGKCLERWTITGEVVLVGDPPPRVRLAGFYTGCQDFYYASGVERRCTPPRLITSVAAFGDEGGPFTLSFDVSSLCPAAGHYIYLILWSDLNANEAFDQGEDWKYVIPLYEDRSFPGATDCIYYFDDRPDEEKGTEPGWNQSAGLAHFAPVRCASLEGALLSNETAW